jgi:uncharacterized damage-inducible protein DinB
MPEDTRRAIPDAADEYTTLDAFLEWHQQTVLHKISGLSEADLRRSIVPSGVTPLGMVKHLAYVHRYWFRNIFVDEPGLPLPWSKEDPDADWRIELTDTTEAMIALYQAEVDQARAICAAATLDAMARNPNRPRNLRWIMVHMIEEIARHNGHLDIIRELTDGVTGE